MKKIIINLKTGCVITILAYYLIITIFYFAAGEQLYFRKSEKEIISVVGDVATPEITQDFFVKQSFLCEMNRIKAFTVQVATFARNNTGSLGIILKNETTNTVLLEKEIDVSLLQDGAITRIELETPTTDVYYQVISIELYSKNAIPGNAVGPLYLSTASMEGMQLYFNNQPVDGILCMNVFGDDVVWTGPRYWKIMSTVGLLLALYCVLLNWKAYKGKKSIVLSIISILKKYKFLIKQLVSRDFKIKYKRSALGALWSFVNPLLTMTVQYYVFSTIFNTDIKYYPVYLLSGVVLFGFFQEASGASIGAIVGNASLITKVYVPKYIYPVSKVLSSGVNLLISFAPLLIMCIITRVPITKAWIIIPYILFCLLLFCIGIGFILSAAMVFFRDIQFIWSVISMLLMYATPIFYPERILPENLRWVLNVNPMYYFIQFFRTIVIEGISPEPMMYVKCLTFAMGTLIIGLFVFRKNQNKFVFYI